jgi:hypothetical protein
MDNGTILFFKVVDQLEQKIVNHFPYPLMMVVGHPKG